MPNAEQFNLAFAGIGGRFTDQNDDFHASILALARDTIDRIRQRSPDLPEVYIDFIDRTQLGAAATKFNNNYFIGINIGTSALLIDMFMRILSCPDRLTDYGEPGLETGPHRVHNPQLIDVRHLINVFYGTGHYPTGLTRRRLATLLYMLAFEYIILHEYAHIVLGHVNYVQSLGDGANRVFDEFTGNGLTNLNSQTLEMHADQLAMKTMVLHIMIYFDTHLNEVHEEYREFHGNNERSLRLLLFSTYSLYRLLGDTWANPHVNDINGTHPPSGIRQRTNINATRDMLVRHVDRLDERVTEISDVVTNEAEDAFQEISETPLDRSAIEFAYSDEGEAHMNNIIVNYPIMRPLLVPFSHIVLGVNL